MSVLVSLAVAFGAFIAGVIFSTTVQKWFKAKSADAVATTKAEVTKVEAKL